MNCWLRLFQLFKRTLSAVLSIHVAFLLAGKISVISFLKSINYSVRIFKRILIFQLQNSPLRIVRKWVSNQSAWEMAAFYGLWPPNGFCRNHKCGIGRFWLSSLGRTFAIRFFFPGRSQWSLRGDHWCKQLEIWCCLGMLNENRLLKALLETIYE